MPLANKVSELIQDWGITYNPSRHSHNQWVFTRFYAGFILAVFFNNLAYTLLAVFAWYLLVSFFVQLFWTMPFMRRCMSLTLVNLVPEMASLYPYVYTFFLGATSGQYYLTTVGHANTLGRLFDLQYPPTWDMVRWCWGLALVLLVLPSGGITCGHNSQWLGCTIGAAILWIINALLLIVLAGVYSQDSADLYFFAGLWFSLLLFGPAFLTPLLLMGENAVLASTIYFDVLAVLARRRTDIFILIPFNVISVTWLSYKTYRRYRTYRASAQAVPRPPPPVLRPVPKNGALAVHVPAWTIPPFRSPMPGAV